MSIARPTTETLEAEPIEVLSVCPDGKGQRRFQMLAYTGAPVARAYGQFVIDLEGIQRRDKVPMLVDHDGGKIAGFADEMILTDRGLELAGVLSSKTKFGLEVAALSDEGFPWQGSVGLDVMEREEVAAGVDCEVNGLKLSGPLSIARKSRLSETSFLYSGADSATYAVALSSQPSEAPVAETDTREDLAKFLKAFPGQEALAAQRFIENKTVTDVKLELAALDREALAAVRAEVETLKAENATLAEELATIKALDVAAGQPGVGFNASSRQGERLAPVAEPKNPKEAWERSERLQAEFPTRAAYEALCRHEGFNPEEGL